MGSPAVLASSGCAWAVWRCLLPVYLEEWQLHTCRRLVRSMLHRLYIGRTCYMFGSYSALSATPPAQRESLRCAAICSKTSTSLLHGRYAHLDFTAYHSGTYVIRVYFLHQAFPLRVLLSVLPDIAPQTIPVYGIRTRLHSCTSSFYLPVESTYLDLPQSQ